jgi:hypothetical protein
MVLAKPLVSIEIPDMLGIALAWRFHGWQFDGTQVTP